MTQPSTITIDGPAAAGKSTVGATLAQRLGYLYFDTGVMYRAVTWAALDHDIAVEDESRVSTLAESITIDVTDDGPADGRLYTVRVDGRDVTWQIRETAVNANVSQVSAYPRVRTALTAQQRRIAAGGGIVMVGRDIGTVVLPTADLKIYLEASAQERARRRYAESQGQQRPADFEQMLTSIRERDALDAANPVSPMRPAEDAIRINTDGLTIDEVVTHLEALVAQTNGAP